LGEQNRALPLDTLPGAQCQRRNQAMDLSAHIAQWTLHCGRPSVAGSGLCTRPFWPAKKTKAQRAIAIAGLKPE